MKLFFSPGACSLAPHIVLNELGMKYEAVKVDLKTKKFSGGDFMKQNPKGYVPALLLDNGELLTEGAVIMPYLADQKPEAKLMPKLGTWDRYKAMELLNFIATEIHKGWGPLWWADRAVKDKDAQAQLKNFAVENLSKKFDYLTDLLKGNNFLLGSQFTVADAYLFTILGWAKWTNIDLSKWPALMGHHERVQTRPAVAKTLEFEKNFKG